MQLTAQREMYSVDHARAGSGCREERQARAGLGIPPCQTGTIEQKILPAGPRTSRAATPRISHISPDAGQVEESELLLRYACSPRVLPLMTTRLNAQRCARLVQQPIVASVSDSVWNFASNSQGYVHRFRRFTVRPALGRC